MEEVYLKNKILPVGLSKKNYLSFMSYESCDWWRRKITFLGRGGGHEQNFSHNNFNIKYEFWHPHLSLPL